MVNYSYNINYHNFRFSRTIGIGPSYSGFMKVLISTSEKEMDYYSEDQIEYYSNFCKIIY